MRVFKTCVLDGRQKLQPVLQNLFAEYNEHEMLHILINSHLSGYSNEAWLLSNLTSRPRWTLIGPEAGVGPSARDGHAMATVGDNTVIFGGATNSGLLAHAHACV